METESLNWTKLTQRQNLNEADALEEQLNDSGIDTKVTPGEISLSDKDISSDTDTEQNERHLEYYDIFVPEHQLEEAHKILEGINPDIDR